MAQDKTMTAAATHGHSSNHATSDGTSRYFFRQTELRNASGSARIVPALFGSTGLSVSPLGFGGYRISDMEPEHREALKRALLSGVNLVDTSANYADGGSERLVGDVLRDLTMEGLIARDEMIIVTKAGYVQGANLAEARRRLAARSPYSEMVEYRPDCWHCISPDFLSDQLSRSLERLRLERVDVFLLHNPEYFLRSGGEREEFEKRLFKAFARLEAEADAGRISWYGVSSNTFAETENRPDFVSLERAFDLAKAAAESLGYKQSRFAVAQLPLNAYEAGAALIANNSGKTTLEAARARKLVVLANRPLNAFWRGRLNRLSPYRKHDEVEVKGELHKFMGRAVELEKKYAAERAAERASGRANEGKADRAAQGLSWAQALREKLGELDDILLWRDALAQQIYPTLSKALDRAQERDPSWAAEYRPLILDLLQLIGKDLETVASKRSDATAAHFTTLAADLKTSKTLSQMAIRFSRSFAGVTSVLVGMRSPEYVTDALELEAPLPVAQAETLAQSLLRRGG